MTIKERIEAALAEDLHTGDLTTEALFEGPQEVQATLKAKGAGILAGCAVFEETFKVLDPAVEVVFYKRDGSAVEAGEEVAALKGDVRAILKGERTALNFIQRMSGIATMTRACVDCVRPYGTAIVDTRKTAPLLRVFDKIAVRAGGGYNHRMGLYDAAMLKENHIRAAGGIRSAVAKVKGTVGHTVKIEVEVTTLAELEEALESGADIVMLDNMTNDEMCAAVERTKGQVILEASGNMTLERLETVAQTGVDVISIGALTHSVKALDMSLLF